MTLRRALVTGNLGFLGRRFHAQLEAAGWRVDGADTGTSRDARDVFRYWDKERFDLVVHCAAVVGGRARIDGRPLDLAVNLELDAALFGWARRTRPGRIAYLSSSAAYPVYYQEGRPPLKRLREDLIGWQVSGPLLPDQLYGWAKLTGEYLARLALADGIPVTVVRPFSGYGEDQSEDYPFGALVGRAVRREDPFTVWGSGQQVRDWIHADDLVAATLALCEAGVSGPVNLCSGRPVTMAALAGMICEQAGYEPSFRFDPGKPSGVLFRVGDPARMLDHYQPRISLADGIARALACHREGARP